MTWPATLDDIRSDPEGDSYPRYLLGPGKDVLILFAAGFYGRQDAYWVAEAGARAVCVDTDARRLADMQKLYPSEWSS